MQNTVYFIGMDRVKEEETYTTSKMTKLLVSNRTYACIFSLYSIDVLLNCSLPSLFIKKVSVLHAIFKIVVRKNNLQSKKKDLKLVAV